MSLVQIQSPLRRLLPNPTVPSNPNTNTYSYQTKALWCSYWLICNIIITFYNKYVLSKLDISPMLNTFVHMSFTFIFSLLYQRCKIPQLTASEFARIVLYSFIFALNIVWFQFAVKLTTLSLNQVTRATTPLFQAIFSYLIANKIYTTYGLAPLIPVCLGVSLTVTSELNLSFTALMVSLFSVVVSALKGVLSMKILQSDLKAKLQEYSLLILVTPLAAIWVVILQIVFYLTIETKDDNNNGYVGDIDEHSVILISIGGVLAFLVNVASFGTVKRTSAVAMGVMANTKQAATIFGSMLLQENNWTFYKLIGVCITLLGAAWYSYRSEVQNLSKTKLMFF